MSTAAPEDVVPSTSSGEIAAAVASLPPPHVIHDLLSVGVCVRCIFRLFRAHGHICASLMLTDPVLWTVMEEAKSCHSSSDENGLIDSGFGSCPYESQEAGNDEKYCCICLGILQFAYNHEQEVNTSCKDRNCVDDFAMMIAEQVKRESYQIDDLCLEVYVPPVILANERAIWLYMKKKYESEDWFKEQIFDEHISVKDALKFSITNSLENHLAVKIGGSSFRIRLTYTHAKASSKLQNFLAMDHGFKRRKTEISSGVGVEGSLEGARKEPNEHTKSESDAVIRKTLNGLPDHVFCQRFVLPPEKADQPCHLTTVCYRMPIYIGGRYLKFSRKVSQSRWIIDDERMGEASVEEIIGSKVLLIFRGDTYKFHASGREDIDVRMLGSGRPFLVEVSNARSLPSSVNVQEIADMVNGSEDKYVSVRNLKVVGSEAWTLMREGEAEKQKQYAALVWISRPLMDEDLQKISSTKNMDILQRTPIRVLHRRSPLERNRMIHWMTAEKIIGSPQYFLLHLCTQAGTYIKEFVHGDLGRTHPSIGSILGCRAEILQLDVTDVMMDCFD